jgi:probable rRNA maturation factor
VKKRRSPRAKRTLNASVSKQPTLRYLIRLDLGNCKIALNTSLLKRLSMELLSSIKIKHKIKASQLEVGVLFCSDKRIRELNKRFRLKDKATDVLSFSMQEGLATSDQILGDLVISLDTAKRQAKLYQVNLYQEILRLLIHGLLHLAGYDHELVSKRQADLMRKLEQQLYQRFLKRAAGLMKAV